MSAVALQEALAAEHAAIFLHSALGARTSRSDAPDLAEALTAAYRVHLQRRSRLIARLDQLGADPIAAEPGYRIPADLNGTGAVRRRALRVERDCAATYAHLVATTTGTDRDLGISWLVDAATRELDFGGKPRRLPGL
ncbi:ferritin-like domain-containing protein [Nocardioides panacisoli]|uniref:DUF4439 domain-containing protein n=1 Tax=Nocardioides panacisoli TaxID=627624 RepID=UPI001C62BFE0|nr:DUF4439 domain-containing protein [Nocardioides panacisoli]QYJ05556.1 ferritin-like domain-containing protein [Nocardioides panacisoli]